MQTKIMRFIRMSLFAAAALALGATAVQAQSYPRVTGTADNVMVDYGPMGQGNLVGGGRVMVSQGQQGMDVDVVHLDAIFSQAPRPGFVPLVVGDRDNVMTVYVPAAMVEMLRRARDAMPAR